MPTPACMTQHVIIEKMSKVVVLGGTNCRSPTGDSPACPNQIFFDRGGLIVSDGCL
jgi:hypothetical protein